MSRHALTAEWRKSSRSAADGACVEVALRDGGVAIRDSKDTSGPVLQVSSPAWRAFVTSVRAGRFDLERN